MCLQTLNYHPRTVITDAGDGSGKSIIKPELMEKLPGHMLSRRELSRGKIRGRGVDDDADVDSDSYSYYSSSFYSYSSSENDSDTLSLDGETEGGGPPVGLFRGLFPLSLREKEEGKEKGEGEGKGEKKGEEKGKGKGKGKAVATAPASAETNRWAGDEGAARLPRDPSAPGPSNVLYKF